MAGGGRRRAEASEGGEEGGGAGGCIAACRFLACPVADAFANPQTTWSPSPSCESISLGVFVFASPPASVCRLLCASVCRLGRCESVHPQQVTPASVCLKEHEALDGLCPCWVDPTGKMMKRWKKDAW